MAPAKKKAKTEHQEKPPPLPRTANNTAASATCAIAHNPLEHAFIIEATEMKGKTLPTLSLLYAHDSAKRGQLMHLFFPTAIRDDPLKIVGSIRGIVCLSSSKVIILWNPTIDQFKEFGIPSPQSNEDVERVSIGFGYDSVKDDYKIVRIICFKPKEYDSPKELIGNQAEIYSSKLGSWKLDFPYEVYSTKNQEIVNGIPFWLGKIKNQEFLIWYDTENDVFQHMPRLISANSEKKYGRAPVIAEWKGHLGCLLYFTDKEVRQFIDVFVHDFSEKRWKLKSTLGPVQIPMDSIDRCSKNGVILGRDKYEDLVLYDPESDDIKRIYMQMFYYKEGLYNDVDEILELSHKAVSYTESLVKINGMRPVVTFCKLPEEIIQSILLRLPVKSLLRCKRLCKLLKAAITQPKFISTHGETNANNPLEHSFIIEATEREENTPPMLSLLYAHESADRSRGQLMHLFYPTEILDIPFEIVGSIHGIVCLASYRYKTRGIILWNPAIDQSKEFCPPDSNEHFERVSIGFGYESEEDDYIIVEISCFEPKRNNSQRAEIYSCKLGAWKRHQAFPYKVHPKKNKTIVKGMPFWDGITSQSKTEVLLWYDIKNDVFQHIPILADSEKYCFKKSVIVEWQGHLGSLMHFWDKETREFIDVIVYHFIEKCWEFKYKLGPIKNLMARIVQCSRVILGQDGMANLFLYDPKSKNVKNLDIRGFYYEQLCNDFYQKKKNADYDIKELLDLCYGEESNEILSKRELLEKKVKTIDNFYKLVFSYEAVTYTESLVKVNGMTAVVRDNYDYN